MAAKSDPQATLRALTATKAQWCRSRGDGRPDRFSALLQVHIPRPDSRQTRVPPLRTRRKGPYTVPLFLLPLTTDTDEGDFTREGRLRALLDREATSGDSEPLLCRRARRHDPQVRLWQVERLEGRQMGSSRGRRK